MVFKEVMLVMSTSQFWTTVGFAFGGFAILFTILIVLVTLFSTPKKPFLYLPKDATFVRELGYTERILYLAHEGLGAYWQCQTSRLRGFELKCRKRYTKRKNNELRMISLYF